MEQDQVARGHGLRRRARWAVPVAAVAATGLIIAGSVVAAGAQQVPSLPARSASQLLADVAQAKAPGPMTATIQESAALGLPDLPDIDGISSALSWASGTHTLQLWYADPAHLRMAVPVQMGETDLRRDGRQVWLWQSSSQTATHLVLPAAASVRAAARASSAQAGRSAQPAGSARAGSASTGSAPGLASAPTPQQAARALLAAVGPTTRVSVQRNVMVAGQPAYQLVVAPRDSRSLIGQIRIAVDASGYLPLQVQVFARGASSPAFQVGYTALSPGRPAASNFAFSPPPGATVRTESVPSGLLKGRAGHAPRGKSPAFQPTVAGQGWLSVAVLPAGDASLAASGVGPQGGGLISESGRGSAAYRSTLTISGQAGPNLALLQALLRSATPVHGSWGSGRLLRTSLFSALLTSNGKLLVGAVRPAVLYADASAPR